MSDAGRLEFDPPPVDPRRVPPARGATNASRHASLSGAAAAVHTWSARQSAYLQLLTQSGGLSDQEAAPLLKCALASVNSVRWALTKRGVEIVPDGFDEHRFVDDSGRPRVTRRTRWRLADAG